MGQIAVLLGEADMRHVIGVLAILLFQPTAQARAENPVTSIQAISSVRLDGNELLRMCNAAVRFDNGSDLNPGETLKAFSCLSYLSGFTDGYVLAVSLSERGYKRTLCSPTEGIETSQAARIVAKWLKENPRVLHERARTSILIALSKAFPCE